MKIKIIKIDVVNVKYNKVSKKNNNHIFNSKISLMIKSFVKLTLLCFSV